MNPRLLAGSAGAIGALSLALLNVATDKPLAWSNAVVLVALIAGVALVSCFGRAPAEPKPPPT